MNARNCTYQLKTVESFVKDKFSVEAMDPIYVSAEGESQDTLVVSVCQSLMKSFATNEVLARTNAETIGSMVPVARIWVDAEGPPTHYPGDSAFDDLGGPMDTPATYADPEMDRQQSELSGTDDDEPSPVKAKAPLAAAPPAQQNQALPAAGVPLEADAGGTLWVVHAVDAKLVPLVRFVAQHRGVMDAGLRAQFATGVLRSVLTGVHTMHGRGCAHMSLDPDLVFLDLDMGSALLTYHGMHARVVPDAGDDLIAVARLALWLLDDMKFGVASTEFLLQYARLDAGRGAALNYSTSRDYRTLLSDVAACGRSHVYHPDVVKFVGRLLAEIAGPGPLCSIEDLLGDVLFATDVRVYFSTLTSVAPAGNQTPLPPALFALIVLKSRRFGLAPAVQLVAVRGPAPTSASSRLAQRRRTAIEMVDAYTRIASRAQYDEFMALYSHHLLAMELLRWLRLLCGHSTLGDSAGFSDTAALHELRDGLALAQAAAPARTVSHLPEAERVEIFLAFCRDSLGMASAMLFTAHELRSGEFDLFVLQVLCTTAVRMYVLTVQRNALHRLDARCPQPSRAMELLAAAGTGCMAGPCDRIAHSALLSVTDFDAVAVQRDAVDAMQPSRHAFMALPATGNPFKGAQRVEMVALQTEVQNGTEATCFLRDPLRPYSFVALWMAKRLGDFAPTVIKAQLPPAAPATVPVSAGASASAPDVTAAAKPPVGRVRAAVALQQSPDASGGAAKAQASSTADDSADTSQLSEEDLKGAEALAKEVTMTVLESGFADTNNPFIVAHCNETDSGKRLLPLLGTTRVGDIKRRYDGDGGDADDPQTAYVELVTLMFNVLVDAATFTRTHAPDPPQWQAFDIATYVKEGGQSVEDCKRFAATNGFPRPQMFSTPKFAEVRSKRVLFLQWLERLRGGLSSLSSGDAARRFTDGGHALMRAQTK